MALAKPGEWSVIVLTQQFSHSPGQVGEHLFPTLTSLLESFNRRYNGGLMVSVLNSWSSSLGSSSCGGHYDKILGKILYSHRASPPRCILKGTCKLNATNMKKPCSELTFHPGEERRNTVFISLLITFVCQGRNLKSQLLMSMKTWMKKFHYGRVI